MTDSTDVVSGDVYSVPLQRPVALTDDELQLFLHWSTLAVLCSGDGAFPLVRFREIADRAVERTKGRGDRDRAAADANIELLDARLAKRLALREELDADRKRELQLANELVGLTSQAERKRTQILIKRNAELELRANKALAELDERRKAALENQETAALADFEERKKQWEDSAEQRRKRADKLQQAYDDQKPAIDAVLGRSGRLGDQMVTKTVSGFLSWLGYASVPATGAVLALLLGAGSFSFDWVLLVTREFARSLPGNPLLQFVQLFLFFSGCLAALMGAVIWVDRRIKIFDKKLWLKKEASGVSVRLGVSEITRRSFVRLMSTLPYILAICMILSLVAVGGQKISDKALHGVFQTIANTFIGSAIALLATAAFMMYAIRIIETRDANGTSKAARGWEFGVPPVALIVAVSFAVAMSNRDHLAWGAWALFMLLTSLSLAYGLVYHGVHKDADKAIELRDEMESEIRALTEPPQRPLLSDKGMRQRMQVDFEYAMDSVRLGRRALAYQLPIKNRNGKEARRSDRTLGRWIGKFFKPHEAPPAEGGVSMEEIDESVAKDLVDELTRIVARKEAHERELADLKQEIEQKKEFSDLRTLEAFEDQRARAIAERERLRAFDREVEAAIRQESVPMELAVGATVAAALLMRNPFANAAGANDPWSDPIIRSILELEGPRAGNGVPTTATDDGAEELSAMTDPAQQAPEGDKGEPVTGVSPGDESPDQESPNETVEPETTEANESPLAPLTDGDDPEHASKMKEPEVDGNE